MMPRLTPLLALLVSTHLVAGCPYISKNALEEKLKSIDEDGDGAPWEFDCNDRNPAINPDAAEIPYDGLDANCDGDDLIDADGDGFPGMSKEAYDAMNPKAGYPEDLVGKPVDCADDPAVYPDAHLIYPDPTRQIEIPYDAIDGDCQKDNDFDDDGDGFMPDMVLVNGTPVPIGPVFDAYLLAWGIAPDAPATWAPPGHNAPQPGDCDDQDPSVHPENAVADVFYDGIDRDCDHHNDFDVDGDCFMPPGAAPFYADYVARYYGTNAPPFCVDADQPFNDCLDELDDDLVSLDGTTAVPAEVHPDTADNPNPDLPYDAIDADCAKDNDFDADGDGFLETRPDILLDMQGYAEMWGYTDLIDTWVDGNPDAGLTTPTLGDCDDTRFDTWPGALEILGDGIDQDCRGDTDVARFGFGDATTDFSWTKPTNPEIARLGNHILILVGAETATIPAIQQEMGVALPFPISAARGGAAPLPQPPFFKAAGSPTVQMQGLLDSAMVTNPIDADGDGLLDPMVMAMYNTDNSFTSYTHLNVNGIQFRTVTNNLIPAGGTTDFVTASYATEAIDLVMNDFGEPFALACSPTRLHLTFTLDDPPFRATATNGNGDACFHETAPYQVGVDWNTDFRVCDQGQCESWNAFVVDPAPPVFVNQGPVADRWVFGDQDEGWISLIDNTGAAFVREVGGPDQQVFPGEQVVHLDVSEVGGVLYVAGVVVGGAGNEVRLAFGVPGAFEVVTLPYDDPSVVGETPDFVAVYADLDRVAVAVTALTGVAQQDSVGWVFLGPAQ